MDKIELTLAECLLSGNNESFCMGRLLVDDTVLNTNRNLLRDLCDRFNWNMEDILRGVEFQKIISKQNKTKG